MIGDQVVRRASQWCYEGTWRFITEWLRVPDQPPLLVGGQDQSIQAFRPSAGYLQYMKLMFWIGLFAVDIVLIFGWILLLVLAPIAGVVTAPIWWFVIVAPDIVAYIAIHLRYDTTWYVLSERSMRIRRGIWIIHETTITYENIQNVSIQQGPIQRFFGIANVMVETAGGGAVGPHGAKMVGHHGMLEGIDNAEVVKGMIMAKWREARSAGLGDERLDDRSHHPTNPAPFNSSPAGCLGIGSTREQQAVLEEIRDLARALAHSR